MQEHQSPAKSELPKDEIVQIILQNQSREIDLKAREFDLKGQELRIREKEIDSQVELAKYSIGAQKEVYNTKQVFASKDKRLFSILGVCVLVIAPASVSYLAVNGHAEFAEKV